MTPLISVIIPVYNRYGMLKEAIKSVLIQENVDFELIVADDGSDDGLASAGLEFFDDPHISLLRLSHSGMPGKVRNLGAEAACGEYLAFLDSDDLWLPGKLARQMEVFSRHPEATIVHTRETWVRNGKEISQRKMRHAREGDIFSDALKKCIIGPSTVMVRRGTYVELQGFRDDIEVAEDYELWLRWTALHPVFYLSEPQIVKRAGNWDQLSWKYGQIEKFRIEGLLDLTESGWFKDHAGPGCQLKAERELAVKCSIYAAGAIKRGRSDEASVYQRIAEKYTAKALQLPPV